MNKHLHIVAFDVPFPPDYGGVIDIYYKLKALHQLDIRIHLHCFEYGRGKRKELEEYCEKVDYYKRKTGAHLVFNPLPYIAATRSAVELLENLKKDGHPILFEGLHCCYYLEHPELRQRRRVVRMHNIEHNYYAGLAQAEKGFLRRKYFTGEAKKLERFEAILAQADAVAAISPPDTAVLSKRYKNVTNIMAFHPHEQVTAKEGKGEFALYHGSLSVGENNSAALYLVNEVFNDTQVPFVIAGNGASNELRAAIKGNTHVQLRENISTDEIYTLVQNAQVNILPTFQATGIKLKFLSALFSGRHCLVNTPMVQDTGLEALCHIANSTSEMKKEVGRLMLVPFDAEGKRKRERVLLERFSNTVNARKLEEIIFKS